MALVESPLRSKAAHGEKGFGLGARQASLPATLPSALAVPSFDSSSAPHLDSETPSVTAGPRAQSSASRHAPLTPEDLLRHVSTQWPTSKSATAAEGAKIAEDADSAEGVPLERSIISSLSVVLPDARGDGPGPSEERPGSAEPATRRLYRASQSCVTTSMQALTLGQSSPVTASTPPAAFPRSGSGNSRPASARRASKAAAIGYHKRTQSVDGSDALGDTVIPPLRFQRSPGEGEGSGRRSRWTPPRTPNFSPTTSSSPVRLMEGNYRVHTSQATLGASSRRNSLTEADINKVLDSLWQQDGMDASDDTSATGKERGNASTLDGQSISRGNSLKFADRGMSPDRGWGAAEHSLGKPRSAEFVKGGAAEHSPAAVGKPRSAEFVKGTLKSDRLGIPRGPSPHRTLGDKVGGGHSPQREFGSASQSGVNPLLSSPSRFKHVNGPGDIPLAPSNVSAPSGSMGSNQGLNQSPSSSSRGSFAGAPKNGGAAEGEKPKKFSAASRSSAARGGANQGWRSAAREKGAGGLSFFAKSTPMTIGTLAPEAGLPFAVAPLPLKPAYDSDTDLKDESSDDEDAEDDVPGPLNMQTPVFKDIKSKVSSSETVIPGDSTGIEVQRLRLFTRTVSAKAATGWGRESVDGGSGEGEGAIGEEKRGGMRRKFALMKASAMWTSAIDRFKGKQLAEEGEGRISQKQRWRSGDKTPQISTPGEQSPVNE
eukprot:TRINITY_DN32327_c0_g1_i1.p1 TRINITY_DN32327_c0_g1~~TRINITY_DN32327_c0_g1_i1.p1  ORF type:complete len:713 (-),score=118.11 TRINITY_DN32327_c0_g1_i1:203-2341(-)